MAEALALLAVLEKASQGEDEDAVDAAHTEDGGEDVIDEAVGEARMSVCTEVLNAVMAF